MAQLPNFLPDFMLVFAVPVLTHTPVYTSNQASISYPRYHQVAYIVPIFDYFKLQ